MTVKEIKDCKIGDSVRLWCSGYGCWDDEVVKVSYIDFYGLVAVEYSSGRIGRVVPTLKCKVVS